ncbi:MAG: MFS transporter [Rudaea sp.]|uniref:MFS transporter n=1 Tax=Rudaea sp. TaxID=2136325 RepID=UPI0039E34CBC
MNSATSARAGHDAGFATGLSLILPIALSTMGAVLLAPIVPKLFEQFHDMPDAGYWIPSLLSVPALCIALFSPFVGALADRIGRRRLLMVAMVVYSLCGMAPLVLDHFAAIFASRVGVGICEAIVMTCSTALIGDCFDPARRDKWLGSQAATASITAFFMFPIAGKLGDALGWRGPFFIYASGLLFLVGVALFTWEPDRRTAHGAVAESAPEPFPWGHMLTVCLITLVGGVMFYVIQFQMASAMASLGVQSAANTGLLISLASLGVPVGAIAFGFVKKRLGIRALLLIEFAIMAVGFWGMAHAAQPYTFIVPGFLNQIGAGLMLPTLLTWAMQPLTFQIRARGTGIWTGTFAIGQFLSTLTFSFVMAHVAGIQAAFGVFAVIAAVTFVVLAVACIQRA